MAKDGVGSHRLQVQNAVLALLVPMDREALKVVVVATFGTAQEARRLVAIRGTGVAAFNVTA